MGSEIRESLDGVIRGVLDEGELAYEHPEVGKFFVTLPGTRKLQTNCWLIVTEHSLVVEAFVCRRPDEGHEEFYRYVLRRNARLYGVHYTVDAVGDLHLIGRIGLHAVTPEELDRVLGQVLEAADGDFNTLLRIGFATAIRREWGWRESRGESLANLRAFSSLVEREGPVRPVTEVEDQQ
ncbi:YbjN domain-containing protein [Actinopolyspora mortivallis]|uniref:YbjN domain-containing protein n=1 Tax=Actinopolyspora mortivallis TaxID=33906 RepID=UPI00047DD197|nr:YbjN domain-containing protein [Actinopolyspora mortivallis]